MPNHPAESMGQIWGDGIQTSKYFFSQSYNCLIVSEKIFIWGWYQNGIFGQSYTFIDKSKNLYTEEGMSLVFFAMDCKSVSYILILGNLLIF
jgi:hypothetical protein